ncbi:acyl carrier protein [Streptomyces sp. NPDC039022]|uniref:acyl carrier protein n=1 Tax=unclassified Streptomyces TaxID=2593676 RepID=UPI0033F0BA18
MPAIPFGVDDLKLILRDGAGADENVDLDGDILDAEFETLGYESLAMLETVSRIEREYGITLDEERFTEARTPRSLIELVNSQLSATRPA